MNGESTNHAELYSKLWGSYESFYGLGQHQAGVWNYRGEAVDLSQDNTNISIPFFLSSNGYGIFWNNMSRSRFNNRFLSALYLSSEVADSVDYYFLYGPEFDKIIAGYRDLTGARRCSASGLTDSGSARTATRRKPNCLAVAQQVPRTAHSCRQHRAGLVLVDHDGRTGLQQGQLSRPEGNDRPLHSEHFHLMISVWPYLPSGQQDLRRHGPAGLLHRQNEDRPASIRKARRCTTRSIPKLANTIGT